MLEAKQKSEAALHKLHQRISSKVNQRDSNPFLAAPAVEQLQLQLPALPAAAAAAAADGAGNVDGAAAGAGASSSAAAAAAAAANGPVSNGHQQPAAASSSAAAAAAAAVATAAYGSNGQQQQVALPLLRQQHRLASAAAAAADGEELEEDMLFESAAVLKAFSSILPPELLAQHADRLQGVSGEGQQQRKQRRPNGAADAANGVEDDLVIEDEDAAAMDVDAADASAAADADPQQMWLQWDGQQDLQQQQQQQQQRPVDLLGPGGAVRTELLRFGIDPLAAGKGTAVRLAGRQRPPDAFADREGRRDGAAGGMGVSSSGRQRKSKYDADPKQQKAEGILNASPEAVYATTEAGRQGVYGDMYGDLGEDV
jgi:hypothetical protein